MARILILILFSILILSQPILFAQEVTGNTTSNQVAVEDKPEKSVALQPLAVGREETSLAAAENVQWVWGEVTEVDQAAGKIKVRYLDYETDADKDEIFLIDKDTQLENIASIAEISVGDSAGIDYLVDKDGQRLVKSISIEKANVVGKQ